VNIVLFSIAAFKTLAISQGR